jgi:hypothetical protein
LFCGSEQAVGRCDIPVEELNAFLAGHADRSIYAAESAALEAVARTLRGEGPWYQMARRPFFGMLDFIKERQVPPDVDLSQWWGQVKDTFGDTILPRRSAASVVRPSTEQRDPA